MNVSNLGHRGDVIFSTTVSNLPAGETLYYTLQKGVDTSYQLGTEDLFYLNASKLIFFSSNTLAFSQSLPQKTLRVLDTAGGFSTLLYTGKTFVTSCLLSSNQFSSEKGVL